MLSRRALLGGLLAMPAVVSIGSLMPLRGVIFDPIIRLQTWKPGTNAVGEYWAHEGPLSKASLVENTMKEMYGIVYWEHVNRTENICGPVVVADGHDLLGTIEYDKGPINASRLGVGPTREELDEHHRLAKDAITRVEQRWEDGKYSGFREVQYVYPPDPVAYRRQTDTLRQQLKAACRWGI